MIEHITKNSNYMQPLIVIQNDGSEILTSNSFCIIKGEVGSGKSRLAMNLMVGLLNGSDNLDFKYTGCPVNKKVIYISTEMSKYHLQKRLLKVLNKVDKSKEANLMFWDISEEDNKLKAVEDICKDNPPYVLIIDQFADFILNINDLESSNYALQRLNKIIAEHNCSIVLIIHQNQEAGINGKARGHLGSFLEQKSVSALAIASVRDKYKIKSTKVREGKKFELLAEFDEANLMLKKSTESASTDDFSNLLTDVIYPISSGDFVKYLVSTYSKSESFVRSNMFEKIILDLKLIKTKKGKFTYINKP